MSNPLPLSDLDHVLERTRSLWDEVRNGNIFVTGGTGFFGRWLLESFIHANERLQLGATLTCLTRNRDVFRAQAPHVAAHASIELCEGDVRSFKFPSEKFTHVIHAATTAAHSVHPLENVTTIVDGTRRVLEFAGTCGAQKVLFTSSGAVYGRQPAEVTHVSEDFLGGPDPLNPASAYGEGKRVAELLCAIYQRQNGPEVKIARCFAFLGPLLPLNTHFAAGNFIGDALRQRPMSIQGDGTPRRSYLYAADLAIWLWTILFRGESGRAYNVGSEESLSILELARVVARECSNSTDVIVGQSPTQESIARPARYVPCTSRAATELDLKTWVSLPDAIRKTAAWYAAERQ